MSGGLYALTFVTSIGCGLAAGVFFAFSSFVMRSLDRIPDRDGMVAMQQINKEAPSPAFMLAFVGMAILSVVMMVLALRNTDEPYSTRLLIGSGLYLVGFVLTAVYHIPRNNALGLLDPSSPAGTKAWKAYVGPWTAWNHVRTATCIGSALAFTLALTAD